jgi:hypothetical protein
MRKPLAALTLLTLLATAPCPAHARQDTGGASAPQYVYEVWGTSSTSQEERPWSEPFDTEAEAQARIKELQRDHGRGGLLESSPEHPTNLRIRKKVKGGDYLDAQRPGSAAAEDAGVEDEFEKEYGRIAGPRLLKEMKKRKRGSTLKEYTKRVRDAYKAAREAKKGLTGLTGKLTRQQFDEVNRLIDGYNKSRADLGGIDRELAAPLLAQFETIERVKGEEGSPGTGTPAGKWVVWVYRDVGGRWEKQDDQSFSSDDQGKAESYFEAAKRRAGFTATSNLPKKDLTGADLVGRRARGTFMDGVTPLTVEFRAGGVGQFSTADESFPGTWTVQGRSVTLRAGASVMTGTIDGSRMSGGVYRANASSVLTGQRLSDRQGTWNLTVE